MLFSIAWKNVWRNKLRSLIVILSIVVGLLGGLFYLAFSNGMVQHQIGAAIQTEISNIQIPIDHKELTGLRIRAKNYGIIPKSKQGAGHKAWLFTDEIILN